jgi:hypothetical protein
MSGGEQAEPRSTDFVVQPAAKITGGSVTADPLTRC